MSNFGELVLVLGDLHIPCRTSKIPYQFQRMLVPNKMQHVICTGNLTSNDIYEQLKSLAPNVHIVSGDYDEHLLSNNNNTNNNTSSSDMMNDPNNNNNNSGNTGAFQPGGFGGGGPPSFPETRIVRVGSFRIGIIHGHQIIPSLRSNRSTTNSSSNNNKNGDNKNAGTSSTGSKDGNHHHDHHHHDHHDGISKIRRCKFPDVDIVITGNTHKNEVMLLSQHDSTPYYHINPGSITGAHTAKSLANSSSNNGVDDVTPSFILLAVQDTKIVCYVYELINDEVEVSKTEINKKQLQQQQQVQSNNNENPALLQSLLK